VCVASAPVDFRKGATGLMALVRDGVKSNVCATFIALLHAFLTIDCKREADAV
jgi:hypothetical protein